MFHLVAVVLLGTTGCGGAHTEPEAPPAAAPAPAPASAAASKPMTGTLRYEEAPKVMSTEAYHHVDFTLAVDEGAPVNLTTSAMVSHDALKALDGRKVELEAVWEEAAAPNPMEAHPIDPSTGEAEKRPGRWSVTSIRESGK
jgi:hypothetical protein